MISLFSYFQIGDLTCKNLKSFYNDSKCCNTDTPDAKISTPCDPVRNFGYPRCYATYMEMENAYQDSTVHAYIPSSSGYAYRPYSWSTPSDCENVPRPLRTLVAHSSPLGLAVLSAAKDPTMPARFDGQLAISLTGSWNRASGTETGYQWDLAKLKIADGKLATAEGSILLNSPKIEYQDWQGNNAISKKYRPTDIHQAFGRTFVATKFNSAPGTFNGVAQLDFVAQTEGSPDFKTAAQGASLSLDCARRLTSTKEYLYVSVYPYNFCEGRATWKLGGNFTSSVFAMKKDNLVEHRMVVGGLHDLDGITVFGDDLYIATSGSSLNRMGNRLLKIANVDAIAASKFSSLSIDHNTVAGYAGVVTEVVKFDFLQDWHAASALTVTPDGKYVLMSKAAACNVGCEGVVLAIDLATKKVYKYASGLRNPAGLHIYDGKLMISGMGSDMGLGTAAEFEGAFGQEGPNDRVLSMDLYTPTELYSVACKDDRHGIVASSKTTCANIIAEAAGGCDGDWNWPEFAIFGSFADVSIKMNCELTCGACPA